jgi:predicted nucleic acid-binding protein
LPLTATVDSNRLRRPATLRNDPHHDACARLLRQRDLPLGAVDASVVALAERFGVTEVATLDRRHFTVVQPRHVDSLTLLP